MSLVRDNSLVHKLRMMAVVELHVNATYTQRPALKSVYGKKSNRLSVMGGKLFSSNREVFKLAQGVQDSTKQVT